MNPKSIYSVILGILAWDLIKSMIPSFQPIVHEVVTTPFSANISWVIISIVLDPENYTVLYGIDMTMLHNTSEVVQGERYNNATNGLLSVAITGLTPFTTYYYNIVATNSVGSTSTSVMNFTTCETAPNTAPNDFTSTTATPTSITFQWIPITDQDANGIVRWYIITCNDTITVNVTGTAIMGTVTGLHPFTDYSCTVQGVTVADGPVSNPVVVKTTEAAPRAPMIIAVTAINSSTVCVTWTRPAVQNGILTSYSVKYVTIAGTRNILVEYNGEETQSYNIIGLSPYQLVAVIITASNRGGTSGPSKEVFGRSSEAAPGIVELTIMGRSNSEVDVLWDPPVQPNGIITGYVVMYSFNENNTLIVSDMLSENDRNFVVGNLEPGIPYQIVVVAFTSVGRGAENKPKYFFSQELTPTKAPENVHYKRLSAVSVNITWTPLTLFEARGFPIYKVSLQLPSTSNRRKKQSSLPESIITTSNFAVFNYLEKNRAYTAVVGVRTHSTEFQIAVAIHVNPVPSSPSPSSSSSLSLAVIIGIMGSVITILILIALICIAVRCYMSRSQNHPILHKTKKRESSVSPATDSIPLIPLNRNEELAVYSPPIISETDLSDCSLSSLSIHLPQLHGSHLTVLDDEGTPKSATHIHVEAPHQHACCEFEDINSSLKTNEKLQLNVERDSFCYSKHGFDGNTAVEAAELPVERQVEESEFSVLQYEDFDFVRKCKDICHVDTYHTTNQVYAKTDHQPASNEHCIHVCDTYFKTPDMLEPNERPPKHLQDSSLVDDPNLLNGGNTQSVFYKVTEDCPLPKKDFAMKIVDQRGGNINIKQHSVFIHIPKNAVATYNLVEVKACGSLVGPFKLPEDYERVSAFVWASAGYTFQQNVQMYLQHCDAANSEEDINDLCVLTANESDKVWDDDEECVYLMREDDADCYFEVGSDECCIHTKSWCTKCVARRRRKLKSRDLNHCVAFAYLSKPVITKIGVSISFEICFCYSLEDCIQTVKEQHREFILLNNAKIYFFLCKNSVLCLKYDSKQCDGWKISHTGKDKITPADLCFQHFKMGDLKALERENAYPPRFFLTLRSNGSIQHLSTIVHVVMKNNEDKKQTCNNGTETLTFPVHTIDYVEFDQDESVLPSDSHLAKKILHGGKEYKLYKKYFAEMTHTLTDIDTLLPYFISKEVINVQDRAVIKSKPRPSDQVNELLMYINGPLSVNDTTSFYSLLDVMEEHGNITTKQLANAMKADRCIGVALSSTDYEAILDDGEVEINETHL
ncbi:uncharacterized protein [Dysidea avara]|uniref:uncharacterized protein isoform X3 n=1 Tax=Dysidea avara TaxID=196820 RepID=UPI00331BF98D